MVLFSLIFNFGLVLILYQMNKLTRSGAFAAFVLGFIVLGFGHLLFYILMLSFLFSSLLINKVILRLIPNIKESVKEHEPRRWVNVLANGSWLGIASILYAFNPSNLIIALAIISMATATADTWASEIGMLSLETPWTIIKRQTMTMGLSGGVTWLGLMASLMGSLFITLVSLPVIIQMSGWTLLTFVLSVFFTFVGFAGSLVDSILGELFQAKFKTTSHEIVEIMHHSSDVLISGVRWMDNHMVNFFSNVITIALFTPLYTVLVR